MKIGMNIKNIQNMYFNGEISKYEFYNKLLSVVTLFRVTLGVT